MHRHRVAVIVTALGLGVIAHTWTFLPPVSMLGWWTWGLVGAPFERWWYTLPDRERSIWLYDLGTTVAALVLPAMVVALFVLWVRPLMRGAAIVPTRTLALIAVVAAASCAYYFVGWQHALKYQGSAFIAVTVSLSVLWVSLLVWLWLRLRRTPTWGASLLLHAAAFAWILILAFPWLGEYI